MSLFPFESPILPFWGFQPLKLEAASCRCWSTPPHSAGFPRTTPGMRCRAGAYSTGGGGKESVKRLTDSLMNRGLPPESGHEIHEIFEPAVCASTDQSDRLRRAARLSPTQ